MPAIQADDILDVITETLRDLGELKWTDIVSTLQEHVAVNMLIRKERVGFKSGYGLQWNVQVRHNNAAKMVGLGEIDQIAIVDGMKVANIPWRHCQTSWAIYRQVIKMNREPRRIIDLLKEARAQGMYALAELLETQFWTLPGGSSDSKSLFGIPYWIVPNATAGFNGGNPYGYSAGAGALSSTDFTNWANYTDSYIDVTKTDLVRKWRKAAMLTRFKPPVNVSIPQYATAPRYGYYTTLFVVQRLEEVLEQQNDNLGNDVASKDGDLHFRKVGVTWTPKLDVLSGSSAFSNTNYTAGTQIQPTNGVYGIDWAVQRPVFLEGEYMVEDGPKPHPSQHTTYQTFIDTTMNMECRDRRKNFVLTQ